jgi:hypothetical protein
MMAPPSSFKALRPLLMSYGGGHAQIIAAVAQRLIQLGCSPDLIGLTTAARLFERSGLVTKTVSALKDPDEAADAEYHEDIKPFIQGQSHPDIRDEETQAYFTIGFRDLVQTIGKDAATARVKMQGRKAFLPVYAMERYLKKTRPNIVVTTTSPRFEWALLQAARRMGIPSLAISDLFLIREREWIIPTTYAEHLTVFADIVADDLHQAGLRGTKIHVTGNPAFDALCSKPEDRARREYLRRALGVEGKTVILWPAAQLGACGRGGDPYATPDDLVPIFEKLCTIDPRFTYILRHHPNSPFTLGPEAAHGLLDKGEISPEDIILVADVICAEVSTMGLQAALRGVPVICVKYAEDAVYPLHGMAQSVDTLEDLLPCLLSREFNTTKTHIEMPELGSATQNVADLILKIAGGNSYNNGG